MPSEGLHFDLNLKHGNGYDCFRRPELCIGMNPIGFIEYAVVQTLSYLALWASEGWLRREGYG
jgi:hypothetical protein